MTTRECNKVPQIRFRNHVSSWRTDSVSSLLSERNVQAPKSEFYPLMAFIAGQGVAPKGARYNREFLVSDELNKKYKQTEYGDFIYSSNNLETGSIGINKYGNASISPVYSIFSPTSSGDSNFIDQLLRRKSFVAEMVKWRQGVVYGQWRIHETDFLKIDVTFPDIYEQRAIGKFLRNLDQLIVLHQRKHAKLVALKKAMLQKMFPKPGATTPEIRFTGFKGDWSKKEFKQIASRNSSISSKSGLPRLEYEDIASGEGCLNKNIFKKSSKKIGLTFEKGDILFGKLRPYLKNWWMAKFPGIAVGDFWVIRAVDSDASFVYRLIQTEEFERVANLSAGSKMPRSDWKLVSGSEFMIPMRNEEQQKIGSYFSNLDALTFQHATQLQKLQQIKFACLEKMFV